MIELHVSETDTFEDGVEAAVPGDMRIVAFADSQAGGEYSDEESRKRKKKRRAVMSKKYALFSFHYNLDIAGDYSSQVILILKGWFLMKLYCHLGGDVKHYTLLSNKLIRIKKKCEEIMKLIAAEGLMLEASALFSPHTGSLTLINSFDTKF